MIIICSSNVGCKRGEPRKESTSSMPSPLSRHPGAGRDPSDHLRTGYQLNNSSYANSKTPFYNEPVDRRVDPGLRRDDGIFDYSGEQLPSFFVTSSKEGANTRV